jgi:hypothetical protein
MDRYSRQVGIYAAALARVSEAVSSGVLLIV